MAQLIREGERHTDCEQFVLSIIQALPDIPCSAEMLMELQGQKLLLVWKGLLCDAEIHLELHV